jgi:hypothetical protein
LRRKHLDDEVVAKLPAKGKRYSRPDPELPGHYVRVSPTGAKSYWVVARGPDRKQKWRPVGKPPMKLADARDVAKGILATIRGADAHSFEMVSAKWQAIAWPADKLREGTIKQYTRSLKRMTEAWAGRDFASIERDDVQELMDLVQVESGMRTAKFRPASV